MFDYITNFKLSNYLSFYTYYVPLIVCSLVYICRFINKYRQDVKDSQEKYYTPTLTIGYILWHVFVAVMPVSNIVAMIFDCMSSVFRAFGKVLNVPLVRKKQ